MKYNSKFFKDNMPLWKRKKDPLFVKLIYRPLSFGVAALFANLGIKANVVTVLSLFPAALCGVLLSINNYIVNIVGALLLSVWLLLDCADGNLARSVERQPYGDFLDALGLKESGLDKLIKASYRLLNLMSYLTAGETETRGWTIKIGTKAPLAAGKIHSDFERGFIKAEVVNYKDLLETGSIAKAKEKGLVRIEGKDYIVQDGDVILFKFNV